MGANQLPSAADMLDIHNALLILAVAFIGAITTTITIGLGIVKWYLPNQFKHRDEARQLEIDGLRNELATKREADAVEIERDRMLPLMVENNQRLVDAMIKSKEADTAATLQRIELDKTTAAVLVANTQQITTHGDQLDENTDRLVAVEKIVSNLYNKMTVAFPNDINVEEMLNEIRGAMAEIKKACADKKKGDSKELPIVTLPPPDAKNILYNGVEPDDLQPTG